MFRKSMTCLTVSILGIGTLAGIYPGGMHEARAEEPKKCAAVTKWFAEYDAVRKEAEMTPTERDEANALLSKGLRPFTSGKKKAAARDIANKMAARYTKANAAMKALNHIQATAELHAGYEKYFATARDLFQDYVKLQANIFAQGTNGEPLRKQLKARKAWLETLDAHNKALDSNLRAKYHIAPH